MFRVITSTTLVLLAVSESGAHAQSTPDFWQCTGRISGSWMPGVVPSACNVSDFGDPNFAAREYKPVIIDLQQPYSNQINGYMSNLKPVLSDAATYYFKTRIPGASQADLDLWTRLVLTVSFHETQWTQYRKGTDGVMKMIRGDYGHGHGMMQIDDRSHKGALLNEDAGWELSQNLVNGMDELYDNWVRAKSASCRGDSLAHVRSVYAAYNGGPSSICRWTNPNSVWAKNDVNFLNSWQKQPWVPYVGNQPSVSLIQIACLMERKPNCATSGTAQPPVPVAQPQAGIQYLAETGEMCVFDQGKFQCISDEKDEECLNVRYQISKTSATPTKISSEWEAQFAKVALDRHVLCAQSGISVARVGQFVRPDRAINLRSKPMGTIIGGVSAGRNYQVLDFAVNTQGYKYYMVQVGSTVGYFYAGDTHENEEWAPIVSPSATDARQIATLGRNVQIVNRSGLNVRATPGGTIVGYAPFGQVSVTTGYVIQDDSNAIYYQIRVPNGLGYVYGGHFLPTSTTSQWVKPLN